eukprot:TRINITY_DN23114_c0_g1_i2.p1 TRINITY_DN23114_c0_g1~~TRINITY_DN23114_c0_g1_i2.p1  ORF type:complete len:435 (+),score=77.04 TRINITY_DN23114_c0_g1_i2:33-1307(+)
MVRPVLRIGAVVAAGTSVVSVAFQPSGGAALGGLQASSGLSQLLPCSSRPASCVEFLGLKEIQELHGWLGAGPDRPENLQIGLSSATSSSLTSSTPPVTDLELAAFSLFKELGFSVLGSVLDFLVICQHGDDRCNHALQHFAQFQALREAFESRMAAIVKDYPPDTGVRSPVIRVGRVMRSDLDRFLGNLPSMASGIAAAEATLGLIHTMGQRSRMLSYHLGMHNWVRTLAVPGRGAPVFILHDEYLSWPEMLRSLVASMVRNGPGQVGMAEVGVPLEAGWSIPALLQEFQGLRYFGFCLEQDSQHPSITVEERYAVFEQLKASIPNIGRPFDLHFTSSSNAATAIPLRSLDIAIVDVSGAREKVVEDLKMWEARVKPGGILAGRGFDSGSPEGVKAVCQQRLNTDMHLGMGGGFWWLVEPDEE